MLPHWPAGTVSILITLGPEPHAIPVSATVRAGERRLLLGLARSRGSLARLRERPQVAVAILAPGVAVTARGRARDTGRALADGVTAVEVLVDSIDDHLRPTFELREGVSWRWTDEAASRRDADVRAALEQLARE